jgi:membrane-associated phospholipid phosphatase
MLPMLFASILALSKVVDYWHHWYDVLAGAIIGTVFGVLSYRAVYWSVWDWRYAPLYPYTVSFLVPSPSPNAVGSS